MIIFMASRSGLTKRLLELMSTRHEQYKKEIDILNKTAEEKKQKTDDAIKLHQDALEGIERDHELRLQDLEAKKREELDTLVKDLEDSPDELAKEVAKLLNAEHVEGS